MKDNMTAIVRETTDIAEEAAALTLKGLGGHPDFTPKGAYDLQIDADIESEHAIIPRLKDLLPGCEISSEETDAPVDWNKRDVWVVDPLDGTNNYFTAIPYLAVSIALRQKQKLVMSVVHDPVLHQSFTACLGQGAHLDGRPVRPSAPNELSRATVSLVTDYSADGRKIGQELYNHLNLLVRRVTTLWAPAADLVRVATGHIDAIICVNALYGDVCGGLLIVSESGGTVLNPEGHDLDVAHLDPTQPISFVASATEDLAVRLRNDLGYAFGSIT